MTSSTHPLHLCHQSNLPQQPLQASHACVNVRLMLGNSTSCPGGGRGVSESSIDPNKDNIETLCCDAFYKPGAHVASALSAIKPPASTLDLIVLHAYYVFLHAYYAN